MNGNGSRIPVKLAYGGRERSGELRIQNWTGRTKVELIVISFAICWCLALISLFIPIVNFVLSPLFIIAAPFVAYFATRERPAIEAGDGTCPNCEHRIVVSRRPLNFPFTEICTNCRANVEVTPGEERTPETPLVEPERRPA